jgi:hypothetical protein
MSLGVPYSKASPVIAMMIMAGKAIGVRAP